MRVAGLGAGFTAGGFLAFGVYALFSWGFLSGQVSAGYVILAPLILIAFAGEGALVGFCTFAVAGLIDYSINNRRRTTLDTPVAFAFYAGLGGLLSLPILVFVGRTGVGPGLLIGPVMVAIAGILVAASLRKRS
jgi:hypothetical protein